MNNSFRHITVCGVELAVSDNIQAPHGFSTRVGGVSRLGGRESLNLGFDRGDDPLAVKENYRRFVHAITQGRLSEECVVYADQIHSDIVRYADRPGKYSPCDGFFTDRRGIVLTVRIADCVPILMHDAHSGVCAALHAGWRSTVLGIAEKGVELLCSAGARKENIQAAVGPCIHSCCYSVGEDFISAVSQARGEDFALRHIALRGGSFFADLVSMNTEILTKSGISAENISASPDCTRCRCELYFSHRATGGERGSLCAAIAL